MNMQSSHSTIKKRGAALLVSLGILAVLLVISVTFFRMSIMESQTASNNANAIQADLLADGAINIAIAQLLEDLQSNPSVTHNDQAWRTRFNGTAFVGKPWWWGSGTDVFFGGIPLMDIDAINDKLLLNNAGAQTMDPSDLDYRLYIPRIEDINQSAGATSIYDTEIPGFVDPETGDFILDRYLDLDGFNNSIFPFAVETGLGISALNASAFGYTSTQIDPHNPTLGTITFENGIDYLDPLGNLEVSGWLTEEQIHFIAEVDVDKDNLNDAMWIPMAADRLYPNDGLDNDLDGYIDEYDLDGEPGLFLYAENYIHGVDDPNDRVIRLTMPLDRMFMMRNVNDPANRWIPVDIAGTVVTIADLAFQANPATVLDNGDPKYSFDTAEYNYTLNSEVPNVLINDNDATDGDDRDNDHNTIIDDGVDGSHYVLNQIVRETIGTGDDDPTGNQFSNHYRYDSLLDLLEAVINDPNFELRILGETTSDIVGRAAIYITDESSKVNITEAGALTYIQNKTENAGTLAAPDLRDLSPTPLFTSTLTGQSANQYDIKVLNGIGHALGERIALRRTGATEGGFALSSLDLELATLYPVDTTYVDVTFPFSTATSPLSPDFAQTVGFADMEQFVYDVSFPGYGFMDDNGSALWMATNGIDDDGDAFWYQTDGIDNDMNGEADEPGEGKLVGTDEGLIPYDYTGDGIREYATLEGIDEPSEFQHFRPYRNAAAEDDLGPSFDGNLDGGVDVAPIDNDGNDIFNEIGEFADKVYLTAEQIVAVDGIGEGTYDDLNAVLTVHSADNNLAHNYTTTVDSDHTVSGIKRDINFATPEEIVQTLLQNFDYIESAPEVVDAANNVYLRDIVDNTFNMDTFALGLRQEDTTVEAPTNILNSALVGNEHVRIEADAELRAYQLAVSAKDFADGNSSRSTLVLTLNDDWILNETISYTQAGVEAIRINELMVRPTRRIEAEATTNTGDVKFRAEYNPNIFSTGNPTPDFNFSVVTTAMHLENLGNRAYYIDPSGPAADVELNGLGTPGDLLDPLQDVWWIENTDTVANPLPVELLEVFNSGAAINASNTSEALMGIRSAYGTNQPYIGYEFDVGGVPVSDDIPNMIQFQFSASEQLPAGRYYLMVNTQTVDATTGDIIETVDSVDDFSYFVGTDDFLTLMTDTLIDGDTTFDINESLSPIALGEDAFGNLTGTAFMQSADMANGFTVEVPAVGTLNVAIFSNMPQGTELAINYFEFSQEPDHEWVELYNTSDQEVDLSGWKLVVEGDNGTEMTVPDNTVISPKGYLLLGTNKYDLVQPIADMLADITGVGGVEDILELRRDFTAIDAAGDGNGTVDIITEALTWPGIQVDSATLLIIDTSGDSELTIAELDAFLGVYTQYYGSIYANGIGLARQTDAGGDFSNITVPPMMTRLQDRVAATIDLYDDYHSVFERDTVDDIGTEDDFYIEDFVDNEGNGYRDADQVSRLNAGGEILGAYTGTKSVDNEIQNTGTQSPYEPAGLDADPAAPWDRIVELDIPRLENLTTLGELAKFILHGGIFPNHPERDGFDNDGDNVTLTSDGINNNGDFVDNNSNGIFDAGDTLGLTDEADEGIDEGGTILYSGNILWFPDLAAPANQPYSRLIPGTFHPFYVPYFLSTGELEYPVDHDSADRTIQSADPPNWKAFVEERLLPGDNVVVTLYEGRPSALSVGLDITKESNIADQVTYSEMDVIDRAKDDILNFPANANQALLNSDLTSMWPANTMGIDFYKSLERKHPLYNGDKHGVINRQQATDGAYDDWADSSHYWKREIELEDTDVLNLDVANSAIENVYALAAGNEAEYRQHALFNHTIFGSPLRMNLPQRLMENASVASAADLQSTFVLEGQFDLALDNDGAGNSVADLPDAHGITLDRQQIFPLATVRNKAIVSPGDLLTLPHFDRVQHYRTPVADNFLADLSAVNQRIIFDDGATAFEAFYGDNSVRQVLLGQTFGDENWDTLVDPADVVPPFFALDYREGDDTNLNELSHDIHMLIANTVANDALSLSVATADVKPFDKIAPFDGSNLDITLVWDATNGGEAQDWVPILQYPLDSDDGLDNNADAGNVTFNSIPGYGTIYQEKYLLDFSIYGVIVPDSLDVNRLPYMRRAGMYASRNSDNIANFDRENNPNDGKEAIFIWDGEDGIENGEYDVYIEVDADLRSLLEAHNNPITGGILNNPFGLGLVTEALGTDFEEMQMDVEIFTDRNGDGRVWAGATVYPADSGDLNSGATVSTINESFELLKDVAPDRNGFINYGSVLIENNFLALFVRNRADSSVLNRISRVVLTPRAKTPGRMNINTVETQLADLQNRFFNPLIGLPGVQYGYEEFDNIYGFDPIIDFAVTVDPAYNPTNVNYNAGVNSFFNNSLDRPSAGEQNQEHIIHYRAEKIVANRPEHADGRYYNFTTDLVAQDTVSPTAGVERMVYPSILSDLARDNGHDDAGVVGNEETPRFLESSERFSRLVNMITTRSDVFKIQVLVETGYVTDANDDGFLNYRDNAEFTTTSEARASVIYER